MTYAVQVPSPLHGAPVVYRDLLSPTVALPTLGLTPTFWPTGPRPASVGASLLAPAPALCCFCWLLGRLDPPARWGPARHSCLLSALLSSRHTASGWISHPTSDSEKGKGRLKGELTAAQCALLSQPEAWPDRHSPSLPAKAPASSPSRSALAASPSSGSLSIALALRMGAISYCFASVRRSVGRWCLGLRHHEG